MKRLYNDCHLALVSYRAPIQDDSTFLRLYYILVDHNVSTRAVQIGISRQTYTVLPRHLYA